MSVVIPCNDDTHLPAMLESLARQEQAPRFEVILIDASGEDLRSGLSSWEDRLDLRVIRAEKDAAAPANRNAGVVVARGSALLFLDADDTVNGSFVRAMTEALEAHELVCCGIDMVALNPWNPAGIHPQQTGLITQDMAFLPFAGAGSLGIRRSLFDAVDGWDPSLRYYPEADLCWKIQLAGHGPPAFVPDAMLHYRLDPSPDGRWKRAVGLGRTEPLLYKRYRHAGMSREPILSVLGAWFAIARDVARMPFGLRPEGLRYRIAIRFGRLQGSWRHRVIYL